MLAKLGDSVTTDHISPAGSIKADSPAGQYLADHGVERKDFNSYGSRRGNHEVMIRGTFANIRLKNLLLDGVEGGFTRNFLDGGEQTTIYDASAAYQEAGIPLVILAGKEYGSGSSRDWAAKGTALLGVRAVIAESYERIHRSNLIGMGVLPLQYPAGENAESLGLTGTETFSISGVDGAQRRRHPADGHGHGDQRGRLGVELRRASCGSTPPARPTTTATAASSSTSCARSSRADRAGSSTGAFPLPTRGCPEFRPSPGGDTGNNLGLEVGKTGFVRATPGRSVVVGWQNPDRRRHRGRPLPAPRLDAPSSVPEPPPRLRR